MKTKKKSKSWSPPAEWFAPSNPEEFKFCFALMVAGRSGQMPIPRPRNLMIEEVGEVSITNTPYNRGMLAVTRHYREAHPRGPDDPTPPEFFALMNRLRELGSFICDFAAKRDARLERYIDREDEAHTGALGVAEPLVEAGATAKIGQRGFNANSLFSIADALVAACDEAVVV